jgi:tRNA(adenine34) deaminase
MADQTWEKWMRQALKLACKAESLGEVPVGAVILRQNPVTKKPQVMATAHNLTHTRQDPGGHAELLALRKAAKKKGSWRLDDCTLVVTLEPCAMCAGAAVLGRIGRIVYGATDPKAGACGSVLQVAQNPALNHRPAVEHGLLAGECGAILKNFFKKRRSQK